MPRPKEFDVDEALARAMETFWSKGYGATSLQDLTRAMQIQRASLYNAYGDKHTLFVRALRSYQEAALATMREALAAGPSPLAALRGVVLGAAERGSTRTGRRGCLCVNANVELAPVDEEVAAILRDHVTAVESLLADSLSRAVAAGELPAAADVRRLATFVYGVLVAISVLGKQRASRNRLQVFAEQALAALHA